MPALVQIGPDPTIQGHPSIAAHREDAPARQITVCAECEATQSESGVNTILWLSGDRWFCTRCRSRGDARPTQIAVTNPARRRR